MNLKGPALRAVLELNPSALAVSFSSEITHIAHSLNYNTASGGFGQGKKTKGSP